MLQVWSDSLIPVGSRDSGKGRQGLPVRDPTTNRRRRCRDAQQPASRSGTLTTLSGPPLTCINRPPPAIALIQSLAVIAIVIGVAIFLYRKLTRLMAEEPEGKR